MATKLLRLFDKRPELLLEWDSEANDGIDLQSIGAWSKGVNYGWRCAQDHSWRATAYTRSSGENCRACLRALGPLSLESYEFMEEWSPVNRAASSYTHLSTEVVYWNCKLCSNSWKCMVYSRVKGAASCPYCAGKEISERDFFEIVELLASSFSGANPMNLSELRVEWKRTLAIWLCADEPHSYEATIQKKLTLKGCPYCSNRRLLPGFNDLPSALPAVYSEWSPKNTLDPHSLLVSSRERVLWLCSKESCKHEWISPVVHRRNGSGCPRCSVSGPRAVNFELSVASSSAVMEYWDEAANRLSPEHIGKGSHQAISLVCKLSHRWEESARKVVSRAERLNRNRAESLKRDGVGAQTEARPQTENHFKGQEESRAKSFAGTEVPLLTADSICPYCSGEVLLQGFNDLKTIYPKIAAQWHPQLNGKRLPTDCLPSSYERVWWLCEQGHTMSRLIAYRTLRYNECSYCTGGSSKIELEVLNFVQEHFPQLKVVSGDRSTLGRKELDVFLPEKNVALEVNGEYWHSDRVKADAESYHSSKLALAESRRVELAFVWEHDWIFNRSATQLSIVKFIESGFKDSLLKRLKSRIDAQG